jgi:hypothetical protein
MKFSQNYLFEYLDMGWGSGASMGDATDKMNKKFRKALKKQALSKRHSYAMKEVKDILKRLKKYDI